jgi:hypothetical protein
LLNLLILHSQTFPISGKKKIVRFKNFISIYLGRIDFRIKPHTLEHELKYDIKISINKLEFVAESDLNHFKNDFDEVYNVFMVKLGGLLDEYGVKEIDAFLNSDYLLNRHSTT